MKSIVEYIKESIVNEGPGAGYELVFKGLKIDRNSIKLGKKNEIIDKSEVRTFTAKLKKGPIDFWCAEGYDWYISSKGVEYDGELMDEYDESDRMVNGGIIEGYVFIDDVDFKNDEDKNDNDIIDYIIDNLDPFDFRYMYGGGYRHAPLEKPMEIASEREPIEVNTAYSYITIDRLQIDAPKISDDVEWYHDNYNDLDKIYYGDEK